MNIFSVPHTWALPRLERGGASEREAHLKTAREHSVAWEKKNGSKSKKWKGEMINKGKTKNWRENELEWKKE